ncbi:hypothetical protein QIS74_01327 [Colletotrichum tabaci]|uniref:Uncharacterized protein n=1 Tax=Colletotrichum tabaci TaxID=1209068 RepID=A0AAV9TRA5_9PEZI
MPETGLRRKRTAEDEDDEGHESLFKRRSRFNDTSHFKWLWSPPCQPPSSPSSSSSSSVLWSQPVPDGMFLTRHDVPRSFSVPPEPFQVRRPRRRGAISVTSSAAPSEMDRHMAQQLQQQVAIIRLKVAAELHTAPDQGCCQEEDNGNVESSDAEIDRIRHELEAVQIDSALPSILGISAEFEQKLRLGPSSRSPDTSRHTDTGSPAVSGSISTSCSVGPCLWESGKARIARDANQNISAPSHHDGHALRQQHVGSGSNGGLWRRPRT